MCARARPAILWGGRRAENPNLEAALDQRAIREEIRQVYDAIGRGGARGPEGLVVPTGAGLARALGYAEEDLAAVPAQLLDAFVGVAPLHRLVDGERGAWVLDLGCGAGVESLLLGRRGLRVASLDASAAMLGRLARGGASEVFPVRGELPLIPLRSGIAAAALMNGSANLVPERRELLGEMRRVLRRGGQLLVADLVALEELPGELRALPEAWAWCLAGAGERGDWERDLSGAGFQDVQIELLEELPPVTRVVIRARAPWR